MNIISHDDHLAIVAKKDAEIAMWKKGFHGLELEIAELVRLLERVERNAVMPDTTWQLLDELINKYKTEKTND